MDPRRVEECEREARKSRFELDRGMTLYWDVPPKDAIDRIDPERVARFLLRVDLAEAEEFQLGDDSWRIGNLPSRLAARLDRDRNSITLARRFRKETRRYTLARAIGYWKLIPNWSRLQLPPALAGHRPGAIKPIEDREADAYADELLMPASLVTGYFSLVFGAQSLRDQRMTEVLVGRLGASREGRVHGADVIGRGRENLSLMAASWVPEERHLPSIAARFGVSALAMSIRLEKLRLI